MWRRRRDCAINCEEEEEETPQGCKLWCWILNPAAEPHNFLRLLVPSFPTRFFFSSFDCYFRITLFFSNAIFCFAGNQVLRSPCIFQVHAFFCSDSFTALYTHPWLISLKFCTFLDSSNWICQIQSSVVGGITIADFLNFNVIRKCYLIVVSWKCNVFGENENTKYFRATLVCLVL